MTSILPAQKHAWLEQRPKLMHKHLACVTSFHWLLNLALSIKIASWNCTHRNYYPLNITMEAICKGHYGPDLELVPDQLLTSEVGSAGGTIKLQQQYSKSCDCYTVPPSEYLNSSSVQSSYNNTEKGFILNVH